MLQCPVFSLAETAEDEFRQAVSFFSNGNYKEAKESFAEMASKYPGDKRFSIFEFMLAKCDFYLGDYANAESEFRDFISEFPGSSYLGAAHFMLGNIEYLKGDKLQSAEEYVRSYNCTEDAGLQSLAHNCLLPLLDVGLSLDELGKLVYQNRRSKLSDELSFKLAQKAVRQRSYVYAKGFLAQYIQDHPDGAYVKEARNLLSEVSSSNQPAYKVGVLIPLSGAYQAYGQNLLRGIKAGLAESYAGRIELVIKDTQENPIETAHKTRKLIEEDGVIAIVGPLKSECAASAAAVADCFSVPLICPAASEEGISSLGNCIFQLSTTTRKMGRAAAEYAIRDMGLWEFVILAPDDVYGADATEGFKEEVEKWGGRIVAEKFYSRGTTDFSKELDSIRDILLAEKEKKEGGIDTTKYVDTQGKPLPPDAIPVEVGGLFLPGYAEDIILVAPQVAFARIDARLLGIGGWKDQRIIELSREYVQNAVFVSDSYEADHNSSSFVVSYQTTYAEKPDRVAALGYDALKLLGSAFDAKASSSRQISDFLNQVKKFKGASGDFNFNSKRENESYSVFTIEGKEFKKLK